MEPVGAVPHRLADPAALPAGLLTCLFTDIEGSTRLLRELGPGFDDLLVRHNEVLRAAWREHRGYEVKTLGDAFMVVFGSASDAVAAAVAAQRELAAVAWPTELPVRVRIGMHTGYARPVDGDYTALVIHQAARVVGAARAGQVLLTEDTAAELERSGLPGDVQVRPLGRFRVRDFDAPIALHAATGPGVLPVGEPPRVRPADGHNLVRPPTSLIGRHDDLTRLRELLADVGLVSLVGPGGVGKTRLATEAALEVAPNWEDGAWFVDLAPVVDAALVGDAIGAAVGAPTAPGAERWPEVLDHMAPRRLLVVLDNCEHLSDGCAHAAGEIIAACPRVAILATSRGPLGLRGERVHRLAPLATGGADAAAVQLFLDRSGGRAQTDRDVIAELCAELDGLPLAIELAAARTTAVPAAEILRHVRRSPTSLRSADPTLPERHRSLGRLLDWGWELLPVEARTVLGRLSVFAGGFSVDAAEVVGAGGDVAAADVPELLWELIDTSLVRLEDAAGATRYRLLETVRAHAASRADAQDLADARRRLAAMLLDRVGPERATRRSWVVDMELELDNVRGVATEVDDDAAAQALAWSIGRYHDAKDRFRVGIGEVSRFLASRPVPGPDRVALLTLLADLHLRLGELDRAEAVLEGAARLAESAGCPEWDDAGIARARGDLALRRDDAAGALAEARRGLVGRRSLRSRARLFNLLAIASAALGDAEAAAEACAEELRAATAAGIDTFLATTHANLAEAYLTLGRRALAAEHQRISLGLAREQGQPVLVAFGLMIAARLVPDARSAVVLQTKADELLAAADYALYEDDRRVRLALLEEAAERVGPEDFEAAVDAGRALVVDEAVDLAERVFTAVGSASETEQGA
jgi:predicted ATPase/class 3 adenylate cyclase